MPILRARGWIASLCALVLVVGSTASAGGDPRPGPADRGFRSVQKLLDLSGLAWIGGDTFLAVHDAKFPEEIRRVRVSLLRLPVDLSGLQWKPLRPRFPGRPGSDLESASRVPGTRKVLLAESGDDASDLDRIWLARVGPRGVRILDFVEWSSFYPAYHNVEGTAVAATDAGDLFLWAERNEGSDRTTLMWTSLTLQPFEIGGSGVTGSVELVLPADLAALYSRPLVGIDVSDAGDVYTVAAFDPDDDGGPFTSAVLKIGSVVAGEVVLDAEPTLVGALDAFKTESVAVRGEGDGFESFAGTDDENYGGTLRPLPRLD